MEFLNLVLNSGFTEKAIIGLFILIGSYFINKVSKSQEELKDEMHNFRLEMRDDMNSFKKEIRDDMKEIRQDMKIILDKVYGLHERITRVETIQDQSSYKAAS